MPGILQRILSVGAQRNSRSVIGQRAKRASRRWHDSGLTAALTLRSIYASERLPRFFERLQKSYTANVREAERWELHAAG
jgi:hypothetical protein